ncbi:hypothetical protein FOA52_013707 [Chlamydomonas sp. UWO 241]|nr:hypothetical protein FOA52_013707 [Chlamydomonas sp. UWO 241]
MHTCAACTHLRPTPVTPGAPVRVLELACGTGASCMHMAQVFSAEAGGCSISGVDIVTDAVECARAAAEEAGVSGCASFVQADVFGLLASGRWGPDRAREMSREQQQEQLTPQEQQGQQQQQQEQQEQQQQLQQLTQQQQEQEQQQQQQQEQLTQQEQQEQQQQQQQEQQEQEQQLQQQQLTRQQQRQQQEQQQQEQQQQQQQEQLTQEQQHQQHQQQQQQQPLFDFVYDCQAFHALRSVDEAGYIKLLEQSLRPGGLLMLLTEERNLTEWAKKSPALSR